jgi:hypothetical protein
MLHISFNCSLHTYIIYGYERSWFLQLLAAAVAARGIMQLTVCSRSNSNKMQNRSDQGLHSYSIIYHTSEINWTTINISWSLQQILCWSDEHHLHLGEAKQCWAKCYLGWYVCPLAHLNDKMSVTLLPQCFFHLLRVHCLDKSIKACSPYSDKHHSPFSASHFFFWIISWTQLMLTVMQYSTRKWTYMLSVVKSKQEHIWKWGSLLMSANEEVQGKKY